MVDELAAGGRTRRFQRLLLAWFATEARPLAWRRTRDPYRVLVSEIMLQQTQAARVEPAYRAFIERFPTAGDLAAASVGEVLTLWRGLGYNRRAVNLHRAGVAIVEQHAGQVPRDLAALKALPGVGEYTARAVLAFAFGDDAAPVDTNVARVLSRAVSGRSHGRAELQRLAEAVLPTDHVREWSSALMDLGARVCTARAPRCTACPVAAACAWRLHGGQADPASGNAVRPRPQGRFAGSDRYHRGRLVDALRRGPLDGDTLAAAAGLEDTGRLAALTSALVDEGLAEWSEGRLYLPG